MWRSSVIGARMRWTLRPHLQPAAQRRVGGLAGRLLDEPPPEPPGPRLDGAVAAHVDPAAHAAGPAQLEAVGDLLDRLEGLEAELDRRAPRAAGERPRPLLDQLERRVERSGLKALDSGTAADDDSMGHSEDGAVRGSAAWAAAAARASRAPASSAS